MLMTEWKLEDALVVEREEGWKEAAGERCCLPNNSLKEPKITNLFI
jgi:hypothetical protein